MKKFLIILIFIAGLTEPFAQTNSCKRIGLMNPTVKNIEKVLYFIHKNIIQVDSFRIIGILSEAQQEAFKHSFEFAAKHSKDHISFELIKNEIPIDSLFCNNQCSQQFQKIFNETDALLFFGGDDIPPKIYGEKTFLTTEMIPKEQNWEISFLYHLTGGYQNAKYIPFVEQRPDYLIFGICLGMQEMNVAAGGTLYQDIPFQIYNQTTFDDVVSSPSDNQHKNYWHNADNTTGELSGLIFHHVKILSGGPLSFTGVTQSPYGVSVHHQAVKNLGKNYNISATSMDGKVIEGIYNTRYHNIYGIQFHTDVTSLYEEGTKYKIAPDKTFELDENSRRYHFEFWKKFSERLNSQK